jgi:hypothetical protein
LMDMLVDFLPIDQVYNFVSSVGLRSQFLGFFGLRATRCQLSCEEGEEGAFWVDIVQQLLRGAIVREHIRTKLTAYDSIEVRSTRIISYLSGFKVGRCNQNT